MIEDFMEEVAVDGGTIDGSLSPMEVTLGFSFLASPLMNHIIVENFEQAYYAHTFVKTHHHAFGYDSTNNEVRWWLEYQCYTYTHEQLWPRKTKCNERQFSCVVGLRNFSCCIRLCW